MTTWSYAAIYRTCADELDVQFLESVKTTFKGKQIEIMVSEADETDYLLRSPANRERLIKAVEDINHGREILVPDQAQFRFASCKYHYG